MLGRTFIRRLGLPVLRETQNSPRVREILVTRIDCPDYPAELVLDKAHNLRQPSWQGNGETTR